MMCTDPSIVLTYLGYPFPSMHSAIRTLCGPSRFSWCATSGWKSASHALLAPDVSRQETGGKRLRDYAAKVKSQLRVDEMWEWFYNTLIHKVLFISYGVKIPIRKN